MKGRGPIAAGSGRGGFVRTMPKRGRQRGFTLLEVILAFALLALALTVLLGSLSSASRSVGYADRAGRAALHARSLLDQAGVGEPLLPGERQGELEQGRYRWRLQVVPWVDPSAPPDQPVGPGAPQLMEVLLTVSWDPGGPREQLQLRTLRLMLPPPAGGSA